MAPPFALTSKAILNVVLSLFLLFTSGALLSLGIFNSAVEKSALSPGALDGVWSSSMAIMTMLSALVMFFTGVSLSNARQTSQAVDVYVDTAKILNYRTRLLFFIGSASYAVLGLAPFGISRNSPLFLNCVVATQAVPSGITFVIALELLQNWMPSHSGLAVGCGQMAFAFGTMVFSQIFQSLLQYFHIDTVFYITAALLFIPSAVSCVFLSWPREHAYEALETEDEFLLHEREAKTISIREMLRLSMFWHYVSTILASQAAFAFYPYFFKLGAAFGSSEQAIVNSFEIILLVSTLSRPFIGVIADNFKWGHGRFSIGPKNMMMLFLFVQLILFVLMIQFSHSGHFGAFVAAVSVIFIVYSSGGCGAALLARDIFGAKNSSLVFGLGGGFGFGFGEFLSGELMTIVDSVNNEPGATRCRYVPFYVIAMLWSLTGLVSCAMMQKHAGKLCGTEMAMSAPCLAPTGDLQDAEAKRALDFSTDYGAMGKATLIVRVAQNEEVGGSLDTAMVEIAIRAL